MSKRSSEDRGLEHKLPRGNFQGQRSDQQERILSLRLQGTSSMPIYLEDDEEETERPSVYGAWTPGAVSTPSYPSLNGRHPSSNSGRSLAPAKRILSKEDYDTQLVDWLTQTDPFLSGMEVLALAKELTGVTKPSFAWLNKRYRSIARNDVVLGRRIQDCKYKDRGVRIASGQSWIDSPFNEEIM